MNKSNKQKITQQEVLQENESSSPTTVVDFTKANKLTDQDRLELEFAKLKKQLATANAEKAIAQNEAAESAFELLVMKIGIKYGLSQGDAINDDGSLVRK